jgi:Na+/H+ antiporter NhaD/arsenite permease-like protein
VNISVGGVLTNFAAPPVLMVAAKWNWSSWFMLTHFGSHALISIIVCNALYFFVFRGEFKKLGDPLDKTREGGRIIHWKDREEAVPRWITLAHLAFLAWTVFTAHYPPLFFGGFLFFLAFVHSTEHHQNPVALRAPLLVGFFLAGLVIHGRCQGWWLDALIDPKLGEWPIMLGSTVLTAFNDNALITFLASQVPGLLDPQKYAVMAGAVAGGGLTVIANAPNPAGQGILKGYFGGTVNPLGLLLAALVPTVIAVCAFMLLWPG